VESRTPDHEAPSGQPAGSGPPDHPLDRVGPGNGASPTSPGLDGRAPHGAGQQPALADTKRRRRSLGGIAALGVLIVANLAKLKGLLLVVAKLKFFASGASAIVSVAAYALIFGLPFAIGFVALLFVHEMGHVIAARREGVKASAPLFIPFLGAAIALKSLPDDAAAEARVGLGGPILGTAGCLVPLGLWLTTGEDIYQALTYTGLFLNLINLAPVLPLDGGRAVVALSPWLWFVGFGLLLGAVVAFPQFAFFLVLVLLLGSYETYRRWRARNTSEGRRFLKVAPRVRLAIAGVYVGLVLVLVAGMNATYLERDLDDADGGSSVTAVR
jgi:Zn-dependent protease